MRGINATFDLQGNSVRRSQWTTTGVVQFPKALRRLADFGYITIPLNNDWNGADFIAQEHDGKSFIKVQLKGRLTFDRKYLGMSLYVCFRDGVGDKSAWYLYDHDEVLAKLTAQGMIEGTTTWKLNKPYHFSTLSEHLKELLKPYQIPWKTGLNR